MDWRYLGPADHVQGRRLVRVAAKAADPKVEISRVQDMPEHPRGGRSPGFRTKKEATAAAGCRSLRREGSSVGVPGLPPPSEGLSEGLDVRNPNCCTAPIAVRAFISEFAMIEVVDHILNEYQSIRPLDAERLADSRLKISRYLEVLGAAGQRDTKQLAMYGLAYLREMHEGRDPRFTGC
jgi:hypothetical protein